MDFYSTKVTIVYYRFGKDHDENGYCSDGAYEIEPFYIEKTEYIDVDPAKFDQGRLSHWNWPDEYKEDSIRFSCSDTASSGFHPVGREPRVVTRTVEIKLCEESESEDMD